MTPRLNKYIPHYPTAKQQAALLLQHILDVFYGGAGGGGKSDWLLMEALLYVHVPSYAAIIFRRTFPELMLPGALIDRSHEWLDKSDAVWNSQEHSWTFPSGARVVFGFLEHDGDERRYASAQFDAVLFDELTSFTEAQFKYLFGRLRRLKDSIIPPRMRSASNPGGPGHEWVKTRFIEGARYVENRAFIPAGLDDNPHIDREMYILSLAETDAETRQQLLEGDWNWKPEGKAFKREYLHGRFLFSRPPLVRAVRYWDFASLKVKRGQTPDWTRGALLGLTAKREPVVADMQSIQGSPGEVEDLVRVTAERDGKKVPVFIEQEPGSAAVFNIDHFKKRVLQGYVCHGNPVTGDKEERFKPFVAQCEIPNVWVVWGNWTEAWLDELERFPTKGVKDDQVDATSGGYEMLFSKKAGRPAIKVMR